MSLVIPWAIFLGATAQLLASINDFKHNNTFGATSFGAYEFSFYGSGASVLKNHFGRTYLPMGNPFGILKK